MDVPLDAVIARARALAEGWPDRRGAHLAGLFATASAPGDRASRDAEEGSSDV